MKKRSLALRMVYPLATLAVIGGVFFGLWTSVLQPRAAVAVPERLADLPLVTSVSGREAIAQIGQLHGTDIAMQGALIAQYASASGARRVVVVWVARTATSAAAAALDSRMITAIQEEASPFGNLRRFPFHGTTVTAVDGPGGEHFFYASRTHPEDVVWLSIQAADSEPLLAAALDLY